MRNFAGFGRSRSSLLASPLSPLLAPLKLPKGVSHSKRILRSSPKPALSWNFLCSSRNNRSCSPQSITHSQPSCYSSLQSMTSSSVHYRTLSVHGLEDDAPSPIPPSSASFLTRRSSFSSPDVKPFSMNSHRKYSDAPSLPFSETPSRRQRTLPKNSKCLRITAYLGWTLAGLLFVVLVVNHSSISPSEHIQNGLARVREHPFASRLLDNVGLNAVGTGGTGAVRVSHASKPGRTPSATGAKKMSGGTKSSVTIVSSFYRIDTGKKHRISGKFEADLDIL